MFLSRLRSVLSNLAALAVLVGISRWRSQPTFLRDFYTGESGSWLVAQWTSGFWYCLTHIRDDYLTAANQVLIAVGNSLTTIRGGGPLSLHGPLNQHWVDTIYVALLFFLFWRVLRRHHGTLPALAVTALVFLMPDNDGRHIIFGEPANVGFFSSLAVVFVYYDILLRKTISIPRLIAGVLLVTLSIFTSPLAAMTAAGLAALVCLKALMVREEGRAFAIRTCVVQGAVLLVSIGIVLHGIMHNPYARPEIAGAGRALSERFVELFFGRQIAYPLLLHCYRDCTDAIALGVSATIFLVVGGVAWTGWRKNRGQGDAHAWWSGPAMLLIACGMALATMTARKSSLVDIGTPYADVQSRYFLAQNMIVVASIGITMLHAARLYPRCRTAMAVTMALWIADFSNVQYERIQEYVATRTPKDAARAWRPSLGRVLGVQSLVGDWQEAASRPTNHGSSLATCPGGVGFRMLVPFAMLERTWPDAKVPSSGECMIDHATRADFKPSARPWTSPLEITNAALCPRAKGLLIRFDVEINNVRSSVSTRHLWVAGLPESTALQAWSVMVPAPETGTARKTKPRENWLFKVYAFVPGPITAESLARVLAGLEIAIGKTPQEILSSARLASIGKPIGWSSLQTDSGFTSVLHPYQELASWHWDGAGISANHVSVEGEDLLVAPLGSLPFDEAAYIRFNPDVAAAVQSGTLSSALAHYQAFGVRENRETDSRSITLTLPGDGLKTSQVDGIEIALTPENRVVAPTALHLSLHGFNGEHADLAMVPVESSMESGVEYQAYYLRNYLQWPEFTARTLDVAFSGMPDGGKLRLSSIRFLGRTTR